MSVICFIFPLITRRISWWPNSFCFLLWYIRNNLFGPLVGKQHSRCQFICDGLGRLVNSVIPQDRLIKSCGTTRNSIPDSMKITHPLYFLTFQCSYLLGWALQLPMAQRLGLLGVGCSPGGLMSNIWSLNLDGDVTLSLVMTFVSSVCALCELHRYWLFIFYKIWNDEYVIHTFENSSLKVNWMHNRIFI